MEQQRLLDMVGESLAEIGSKMRYKHLPETPPGCESLNGKTIAMVDDAEPIFWNFIPHLVATTKTKPLAIVYTDQEPNDLARTLITKKPDVILMDYRLGRPNDDLWGSDMVAALRAQDYHGIIIGFSSESSYDGAFRRAGTDATVKKDFEHIPETLRSVADVVSAHKGAAE